MEVGNIMEQRELICIGCPMGCMMTADVNEEGEVTISGNTCIRGEIYGKKELTNPTRIVTSTVKVKNGMQPVVSVKTKTDIPKDKIFACMEAMKQVCVEAPVHIGDVVIENVAGTGVDVVATSKVVAL